MDLYEFVLIHIYMYIYIYIYIYIYFFLKTKLFVLDGEMWLDKVDGTTLPSNLSPHPQLWRRPVATQLRGLF